MRILFVLAFLGFFFLCGSFVLSQDRVIIDDPSFCRLVVRENFDHRLMWATDYLLEVQVTDSGEPLKISYLLLDSLGTPKKPTQDMEVRGSNFVAGWDSGKQYFFRAEVGKGSSYFPFPHYRTALFVLAGERKMYAVFLRENDRRITSLVLQGGPFEGLTIPGLGEVQVFDNRLRVRSFGTPIEVGLWTNGVYLHDEVSGYARPEFAQNPKLYDLPLGFFMLVVARYGKIGVILGEKRSQGFVAFALSGTQTLGEEGVPELCRIWGLSGPQVVIASLGEPVEVTHFSFDNACYQWEVGGWARPEFQENPQVLPLNHYTPGFLLLSRYDRVGLFFYNENDGIVGILPVGKGTSFQIQDFSFALLRAVALHEGTNVLLSPVSLTESLLVLLGGACGETEKALLTLLGFQGRSAGEVRNEWANLRKDLKAIEEDPDVTFSVANALWGRRGVTFRQEFLRESESLLDAHFETLDFRDPQAVTRINGWVQEHTEGYIEQLLERLRPEDILVITNATFLRARWTWAFDLGKTRNAFFLLPDGQRISWPMMERVGNFPYFENDLLQLVALPYGRTQRLRMYILLPKEGIPLEDLLRALSAWNWRAWRSALENRRGVVRIPRFTLSSQRELKEALEILGAGIMFSPSASFCRLLDGLAFVSSFRHGTFIKVDEEGTEASGGTAVVISKGLQDLFHFVADRPFCFILEDASKETLLFIGVLVDPRGISGTYFSLK
ncbi:MAG: serpin family protein [Atribacterota bacterium]